MNCANHPELEATAYCRTCGKPMCDQCRRDSFGTVYCDEHVAAAVPPVPPPGAGVPPPFSPYATVPPTPRVYASVSPGLALFLGFIPGVGAIYNGQYAKGILHAVIWGVLMSIADSHAMRDAQPVGVITVMAYWAYMAGCICRFIGLMRRYLARPDIRFLMHQGMVMVTLAGLFGVMWLV